MWWILHSKLAVSTRLDSSHFARIYLMVSGIALPTQSITVEKDIALPTTRKKQSFDDLLSLMKHYNANTRKGIYHLFVR